MKNNIYTFLILLTLPTIAMSQQIVASFHLPLSVMGIFIPIHIIFKGIKASNILSP